MTVQDNQRAIRRALNCGAKDYVLECDAGNELVAAVRTAIQGGEYPSANARLAVEQFRGTSTDPATGEKRLSSHVERASVHEYPCVSSVGLTLPRYSRMMTMK